MHRRSTSELLSFDLEIERTLFRNRKMKSGNIRMEEQKTDRYSEGHSDQNEIPERKEPTLRDSWRLLLNENFSGIRHQSIDANNFELKPTLISMV